METGGDTLANRAPLPEPWQGDAPQLLRFLETRGFERPDRWLDFARRNRFQAVEATWLRQCPNCGSAPGPLVGSYVFYSNRAHLVSCPSCGLVWSDLRLDPATVKRHFELTYKSDRYFRARGPIFEQVAALVDDMAPRGARVLDVGGATGHLMRRLKDRRPDISVAVNDLSAQACATVRARFGFPTIRGSIGDLAELDGVFDVLVLCDVIYCEPDVGSLWRVLRDRVVDGGSILIRVPNKLRAMSIAHGLRRAVRARGRDVSWQARIPFFNPEHLFVFTRGFLKGQLGRLGYRDIRVHPSRMLGEGRLRDAGYAVAQALERLTANHVVATPAMIVTARKGEGAGPPHA